MRATLDLFVLASILLAIGCDGSSLNEPPVAGPRVKLIYAGEPLADVQVSLHADKTVAKPLLQGLSDANGVATLLPPDGQDLSLATLSENRLPITLQSLGNGGWILDPNLSELAKSQLTVRLSTSEPTTIEIPRGSVKAL